jgi:hypothetical protein
MKWLTYGLLSCRDMRANRFIKLVEALGHGSSPVPLQMAGKDDND